MIEHPFGGIVAESESAAVSGRRHFLKRAAQWGVGLIALALGKSAHAQSSRGSIRHDEPDGRVTTYALGEEGGRGDGRVTTYALGEEGGRGDRHDYTTRALGEEGGRGEYTTRALGEEGGGWRHPPRYTTYALGEEGGRYHRPPPPRYTTYALGEEGGWSRPPYRHDDWWF